MRRLSGNLPISALFVVTQLVTRTGNWDKEVHLPIWNLVTSFLFLPLSLRPLPHLFFVRFLIMCDFVIVTVLLPVIMQFLQRVRTARNKDH